MKSCIHLRNTFSSIITSRTRLILLLVFLGQYLFAQLTLNLSSSVSTCENNGSVTALVSGEGPFSFSISSDTGLISLNTSLSNEFVWGSLGPDLYHVTVTNTTEVRSGSIIVNGSYIQHSLDLKIEKEVSCTGLSDGIISVDVKGGNDPFEFQLYLGGYDGSASPVRTNSTGYFENLSSDLYTFAVIDSCGNQTVRTYFLDVEDPVFGFSIDTTRIACDTFGIKLKLSSFTNLQPHLFRISAPPELETSFSEQDSFTIFGSNEMALQFEVMNSCGATQRRGIVLNRIILKPIIINYDCDHFEFSVTSSGLTSPYIYQIVTFNLDTINIEEEGSFELAEYNNLYTIIAKDNCGREVIRPFVENKYSSILRWSISKNPCDLLDANVSLVLDGLAVSDVTVYFIDYPVDYMGDTVVIYNNESTNYVIRPNSAGDFVEGSYKMVLIDGCGTTDTISTLVKNEDLLMVELNYDFIPQCGDYSILNFNVISNSTQVINGDSRLYSIVDSIVYDEIMEEKDSGQYLNILPGEYIFEYQKCGLDNQFIRDTISFDTTTFPVIKTASIINCSDEDSIAIYINGEFGIPNYEYRILEGPVGDLIYPTDWQIEPLFEKVLIGDNYKVQLRDQCGAITSYDVSENLNIEPMITEDYRRCADDTIIFSIVDPLLGVEYFWELPDDKIETGQEIRLNKNEVTDTLFLETNVTGCSSANSYYVWSGECIESLPVEWLYFEGYYVDEKVILEWGTAIEIANDYFVLEKSLNLLNWQSVNITDGHGYAYEENDYIAFDTEFQSGVVYYRLKQVDWDGYYEYSSIISIEVPAQSNKLFPNPTKGQIDIIGEGKEDLYIKVIDTNGKLLLEFHNYQINIEFLPEGLYIVEAYHSSHLVLREKVIKI